MHESIFDAFSQALFAAAKNMKVNDGFAENTFLGPVQNRMQFEKANGFRRNLENGQGEIKAAGNLSRNAQSKGYFMDPIVVERPSDDSEIVREEPFGKETLSIKCFVCENG